MSNSPKRPYDVMWPIARDLVERLRPFCQRIEIAGSLRRGKAEIGDIEIMAIPCPVRVRFDGLIKSPYQLDWVLEERVRQQRIVLVRNGPRQKSFHFNLKDVGQVDVERGRERDGQVVRLGRGRGGGSGGFRRFGPRASRPVRRGPGGRHVRLRHRVHRLATRLAKQRAGEMLRATGRTVIHESSCPIRERVPYFSSLRPSADMAPRWANCWASSCACRARRKSPVSM